MIGIYKFDFCLCGGQIYMASDKDQKKRSLAIGLVVKTKGNINCMVMTH